MLFRKAALVLAIVLLLIIAGAAAWFWNSQHRLYSSPTAVRTNDMYLRAHAPATNPPAFATNHFSSIIVEQSTNQIEVWVPGTYNSNFDQDYEPLTTQQVIATEPALVENGSVRLAYIATAYATLTTNIQYSIDLPANFYTPDLRPVSAADTSGVVPDYDRKLDVRGDFPHVKLYFVRSNLSNFKLLKLAAFDARTGHYITSGYSSSDSGNVSWLETSIRLWHPTPVELIATIASGTVQTYTMPAAPGSDLEYPGGILRLLAVSEADFTSSSSSYDGRTNHMTFRASPMTRSPRDQRPRTSLIFYSFPGSRIQGDFEFYDHEGNKLQDFGGGTSGDIIHRRIIAHADEVKELRLKYYPNLHRLIFTLPEIPGLPEENRNIQNLFDLHVPYIRFQYEYSFQENIAQLLQMKHSHLPLTFPNGYFPTFRTNTTPRALFNEMASLLSNSEHQLIADPERNEIAVRPHPVRVLIEKLKKRFGL